METLQKELIDDVKDHIAWDNRINSDNIQVDMANDHTVILKGSAPSLYDKVTAEFDAYSVPGVNEIINQIEIAPLEVESLSDNEIKTALQTIFQWDARLTPADIHIEVNDGVVKLTGSVGAYWEKNIAVNHTHNMAGVKGIVDHMTVVPTLDVLDEDIANDIRRALQRKRIIENDNITVETVNNIVTLRGQVPTVMAKQKAEEVAAHTKGVKDVSNKLVIKPNF
ncbi:BON domain-containing protein [Cytophagaceae bacterium ABcell3]|nr:BON domain-containing protein [Cytophagaceae bacterium ABcell3]